MSFKDHHTLMGSKRKFRAGSEWTFRTYCHRQLLKQTAAATERDWINSQKTSPLKAWLSPPTHWIQMWVLQKQKGT